jgi:hypothetical protein
VVLVRFNVLGVFQMATHVNGSHEHSAREIDRLLKIFSELDDAGMETERAVAAANHYGRPASRLTQPILQQGNDRILLDGARQGHSFAKRLGLASAERSFPTGM